MNPDYFKNLGGRARLENLPKYSVLNIKGGGTLANPTEVKASGIFLYILNTSGIANISLALEKPSNHYIPLNTNRAIQLPFTQFYLADGGLSTDIIQILVSDFPDALRNI